MDHVKNTSKTIRDIEATGGTKTNGTGSPVVHSRKFIRKVFKVVGNSTKDNIKSTKKSLCRRKTRKTKKTGTSDGYTRSSAFTAK